MPPLSSETDFIVVGGGIAGLRAAIGLAEAGRVLVITKQEVTESNTQYAQGGIAVALSDDDEVELHLQDTIDAGDGLVNVEAARVLVEEGPQRIQELIDWGTQFDRSGTRLSFTREGAHSRSRILHAHGDSTGREIGRALIARAQAISGIEFTEFEFTADLCLDGDRVSGVSLLSPNGIRESVSAKAVLLATGGAGQVYSDTTNPSVATGDGIAMAYRVGAAISDMEFFQFHPTALSLPGAPRFLLSEALRGEGALLLNSERERFMLRYHPQAELAPRDVVARAIVQEIANRNRKPAVAYLDLRHLDAAILRARFPRIYATCQQYGIDITRDLIPVRPAAHYLMGGIKTDLSGRSSVGGLYAAGEAACTGVHGANRLASNSLLEGLVFGARVADAMRNETGLQPARTRAVPESKTSSTSAIEVAQQLRQTMWEHAGVLRKKEGLQRLQQQISEWKRTLEGASDRQSIETRNLLIVGDLIARSALAREESRGAHFRTDFPQRDDEHFLKHSILKRDQITFA
ncbi:MAG TPA: L-aspartate oxidase [Terriglobales bacterium]|nr:L-aspartate oxidase [Terriglobales bacterium]